MVFRWVVSLHDFIGEACCWWLLSFDRAEVVGPGLNHVGWWLFLLDFFCLRWVLGFGDGPSLWRGEGRYLWVISVVVLW